MSIKQYLLYTLIVVTFTLSQTSRLYAVIKKSRDDAPLTRLSEEASRQKVLQLYDQYTKRVEDLFPLVSQVFVEHASLVPNHEAIITELSQETDIMLLEDLDSDFGVARDSASSAIGLVADALDKAYVAVFDDYLGLFRSTMFYPVFGAEGFEKVQEFNLWLQKKLAYYKNVLLNQARTTPAINGKKGPTRKILVIAYERLCNEILRLYVSFEKGLRFFAHTKGPFVISSLDASLQSYKEKLVENLDKSLARKIARVTKTLTKDITALKVLIDTKVANKTIDSFYERFVAALSKDSRLHAMFKEIEGAYQLESRATVLRAYLDHLHTDYQKSMALYHKTSIESLDSMVFCGYNSAEIKKSMADKATMTGNFFLTKFNKKKGAIDQAARFLYKIKNILLDI